MSLYGLKIKPYLIVRIMRFSALFLTILFCFSSALGQTPQIIHIKKTDDSFYFFQKGKSTDTITKTKGNLFYLIVKGKVRDRLIINIENAQLLKTFNDSIYKLNFVKGIAYECLFEKNINDDSNMKSKKNKNDVTFSSEFKCLINGISSGNKNKIILRFKIKGDSGYFLENSFWFEE